MAAVEVGNAGQPADAQWKPINANALDIQELGKFAVGEQNRTHCGGLIFKTVDEAWDMILASDYGNLYLLHLTVLFGNSEPKYHAIVWVKPKECVSDGCHDRRTLVSFKELSPAAGAA